MLKNDDAGNTMFASKANEARCKVLTRPLRAVLVSMYVLQCATKTATIGNGSDGGVRYDGGHGYGDNDDDFYGGDRSGSILEEAGKPSIISDRATIRSQTSRKMAAMYANMGKVQQQYIDQRYELEQLKDEHEKIKAACGVEATESRAQVNKLRAPHVADMKRRALEVSPANEYASMLMAEATRSTVKDDSEAESKRYGSSGQHSKASGLLQSMRMLSEVWTGEQACEGHDHDVDQCTSIGCCFYADGQCWSNVGNALCRVPTPVPTAGYVRFTFGSTCEANGYLIVSSKTQCTHAGVALTLLDGVVGTNWWRGWPCGCIYAGNHLYFKDPRGESNCGACGKAEVGFRVDCICKACVPTKDFDVDKTCPGYFSARRRTCVCPCFAGELETSGDRSHRRRCGADNGGKCPSGTYNDGESDDCQECPPGMIPYADQTGCYEAIIGYKQKCDDQTWPGVPANLGYYIVQTNFRTCNDYCQEQGHACAAAADNSAGCAGDDGFNYKTQFACGNPMGDQICVCVLAPNVPAINGTCGDPDPAIYGTTDYICPFGYQGISPAVPNGTCTDAVTCNANCCDAFSPKTRDELKTVLYEYINLLDFEERGHINNWDTSKITDMRDIGFHSFFDEAINAWNTAQVTDMTSMFQSACRFNQDLNTWNTGQVTTMALMFQGACIFDQPIDKWNTAHVTEMVGMFTSAHNFNQSLDTWNTSQVTSLQGMFQFAKEFNQALNSWNTAQVFDMKSTFTHAYAFNQDLNGWNTAQVVDTSYMFYDASAFNQNLSAWRMAEVRDDDAMWDGADSMQFPKPAAGCKIPKWRPLGYTVTTCRTDSGEQQPLFDCEVVCASGWVGTVVKKCWKETGSALEGCKVCTRGTYENVTMCDNCTAGTFSSDDASTACVACPAGRYSTPISSSCKECADGTVPNSEKSSCIPCDAGKKSNSGDPICIPCALGWVSPKGSPNCTQCEVGKKPNEQKNDCKDCEPGKFSNRGDGICSPCAANQIAQAGASICLTCRGGRIPDIAQEKCTSCVAGRFSISGSTVCEACEPGRYSSKSARECIDCAAGTYPDGNRVTCLSCEAGKKSDKGEAYCSACGAGKYSKYSETQCRDCEAGKIANENNSACLTCGMGTISSKGAASCTACDVGWVAEAGSERCTQCLGGTVQGIAQESCIVCDAGKYSDVASTVCQKCDAGQHASRSGSSACNTCAGGEVPDDRQTICVKCEAGTKSTDGESACTACGAGQYSSTGASACTDCAAGKYPNAHKNGCVPCEAGKRSYSRDSVCTPCAVGWVSTKGSRECEQCDRGKKPNRWKNYCEDCAAGKSSNKGEGVCNACVSGQVAIAGSGACMPCPGGSYPNANRSGCLLCGAGKKSNTGDSLCTYCNAGRYSKNNSIECTECPLGMYAGFGDTMCSLCAPGSAPSSDRDRCLPCPAGRSAMRGDEACAPCADGSYPNLIKSGCLLCEAGKTSSAGDSICMYCEEGKYSSQGKGACTDCAAGRYPNLNKSACLSCVAGRYSGKGDSFCIFCDIGQVAVPGSPTCKQCDLVGSSPNADKSNCSLCEAGKSSNVGDKTCTACEAGRYSSEKGKLSCHLCEPGWYASLQGASQCQRCPGTRMTTMSKVLERGELRWVHRDGAENKSWCGCVKQTRMNAAGYCVDCEDGLDCIGMGEFFVKYGYAAEAAAFGELSVFKCHGLELRCKGGTPGETCADGREGVSCAQCMRMRTPSADGTCVECGRRDTLPLVFVCVVACCLLMFMYRLVAKTENAKQNPWLLLCGMSCSIMVTCSQQIGLIRMLSIHWPVRLTNILDFFRILAIDVEFLRLNCVARASSLGIFLVKISVIGMGIIAVILIHLGFVQIFHHGRFWEHHPSLVCVLGLFTMIFYISMTGTILEPLQCLPNPNGEETVLAYQAVVCWQTHEHRMMVLAGLTALLVPVSYLVHCAFVVRKFPERMIQGNTRFLRMYMFLFIRYRAEMYWYAPAHMCRSLLLSISPIIPKLVGQLLTMQILTITHLVGIVYLTPWRIQHANFLEAFVTALILLILSVASLLAGEVAESEIVSICIAFICSTVIMVPLTITYAIFVYLSKRRRKAFTYFLCHHKVGACCLARLLRLCFQDMQFTAFLDSDNLSNLDRLFDYVASDTQNLIVVCSVDILMRPWCVGEIVTGMLHQVKTIKILFTEFEEPGEEFIQDYDDYVDVSALTSRGISKSMIEKGIRWLLSSCQELQLPSYATKNTVDSLVSKITAICAKGEHVAGLVSIKHDLFPSDAQVIVLRDHSSFEITAFALVLVKLLIPLVALRTELIPYILPKEKTIPETVGILILVCSNGAFQQPHLLRSLQIAADRPHGCYSIPVLAEENFRFPTRHSLEGTRTSVAFACEDEEAMFALIADVFKIIAVNLQPDRAEAVLRTQALAIARRLTKHNFKAQIESTITWSTTSFLRYRPSPAQIIDSVSVGSTEGFDDYI